MTLGGGMTSEKTRPGFSGVGAEDVGVNPPLRPMRFEPLGLVDFLNLHGKYQYIRAGKGGEKRTHVCREFGWNRSVAAAGDIRTYRRVGPGRQ